VNFRFTNENTAVKILQAGSVIALKGNPRKNTEVHQLEKKLHFVYQDVLDVNVE
jgi:hypothetical protein